MKIVIDIPEDMYNDIQKHLTDDSQCYALSDYKLREVIRNGKPYEERPQGEWEEMSDKYGHSSCFCTRCGTQEGKATKICPNCGAKMTKEAENDKS